MTYQVAAVVGMLVRMGRFVSAVVHTLRQTLFVDTPAASVTRMCWACNASQRGQTLQAVGLGLALLVHVLRVHLRRSQAVFRVASLMSALGHAVTI